MLICLHEVGGNFFLLVRLNLPPCFNLHATGPTVNWTTLDHRVCVSASLRLPHHQGRTINLRLHQLATRPCIETVPEPLVEELPTFAPETLLVESLAPDPVPLEEPPMSPHPWALVSPKLGGTLIFFVYLGGVSWGLYFLYPWRPLNFGWSF